MSRSTRIPPIQMKFLEEIGKTGSEQAVAAIASLLKIPATIRVLKTMHVAVPEIARLPQLPGEVFLGTYFTIDGERMGGTLVMIARDAACRIVDVACRKPIGTTRVLDEYAQSVVREVGNIMTGAYLSAIRALVPVPLIHSIPDLVMDEWGSVLDTLATSLPEAVESTVLIETELEMTTIDAQLLLILIVGEWAFSPASGPQRAPTS